MGKSKKIWIDQVILKLCIYDFSSRSGVWVLNFWSATSTFRFKSQLKTEAYGDCNPEYPLCSGDRIVERLIKPETNLLYVSHSDMFHVIRTIHEITDHGSRDVMHYRAKQQFVNVTKEVLQLYYDMCHQCQVRPQRDHGYGCRPLDICCGQCGYLEQCEQ